MLAEFCRNNLIIIIHGYHARYTSMLLLINYYEINKVIINDITNSVLRINKPVIINH